MNVWGAQIRPPNMNRAVAAWLLNAGLMGRAERRFFEGAIAPGQIVVDVGANQGIFTLLFSRLVGPDGRVVALEPEPALFKALDRNCRINDADNVTRLQAAAGEQRARGVLRCSRFNGGDNRLVDTLVDSRQPSVSVEIAPLDQILPTEQVSFIKIDVQGYELKVVKGMHAILQRNPAIKVFFEYWPYGLKHAGSIPGDLLDFFIDRGFSLFELSGVGLRKVPDANVARSTNASVPSWNSFLATRE